MSSRARDVQISGLAPGYRDLAVTISGVPVSRSLRGFTLDARADTEPRLTLDVVVRDASTVSGQMIVDIPDATRETLLALGWTPPDA
jgi:hypothetical protein